MIEKGIILAGGTGSRMSPVTKAVNKQLLPLYDKPLFFYPLSVLMLAKIKDILIIVNKGQVEQFKKILPNGLNLGIKISYIEQKSPKGLPDAFIIGENYNIGSNVDLTNIELTKLILKIIRGKLSKIGKRVKIKFVKDRPGHDIRYALNSRKIQKKLKWKAFIKIHEGLSETIDWYIDNQKYFKSLSKKEHVNRIGLKV